VVKFKIFEPYIKLVWLSSNCNLLSILNFLKSKHLHAIRDNKQSFRNFGRINLPSQSFGCKSSNKRQSKKEKKATTEKENCTQTEAAMEKVSNMRSYISQVTVQGCS